MSELPGYPIKTYRYLRLAMVNMLVLLGALAVLLGGFGWFHWGRDSFIANAHYAAALPLFGVIVAVAVINARGFAHRQTGGMAATDVARNRYFVIAALMVLMPILEWLVSLVVTANHVVLWVETTELVLFAAFWLLQTQELWGKGLRDSAVSAH
jgi:hypothetical protein